MNMVADAIGRGETVLVVCQKQAALRVVQKRLEAEGLGERLFMVVDINRDREAVIRALRDQLDRVRGAPAGQTAALRRGREETAARIETLESEVDRHHQALHAVDDLTGLSYRAMLGELIGIEAQGATVDVPALRTVFATLTRGQLSAIEEVCAPLAPLWLEASFEDSPLSVLRPFMVDDAIAQELKTDLSAFLKAETARRDALTTAPPSFDTDDPSPYQSWLAAHGSTFQDMPDDTRRNLATWLGLFRPGHDGKAPGLEIVRTLDEAAQDLGAMDPGHHDDALFDKVSSLSPGDLRTWSDRAVAATAPASFWSRLNPGYWMRRRKLQAFLAEAGEEASDARIIGLRDALALEYRLRPWRRQVKDIRETLGLATDGSAATLKVLRRTVDQMLAEVRPVATAADAVLACPRVGDAEEMVRSGSAEGYASLRQRFEGAFTRHSARKESRAKLDALNRWFHEDWITACESKIRDGVSTVEMLQGVIGTIRTLAPYQRFRIRAATISPEAMRVFAALRGREAALRAVPAEALEDLVRRTLRREALLAWKGRVEATRPELLLEREEIERKVKSLAELDRGMRALNKRLLAEDIDRDQLGTQAAWEEITRLRGPRMKRLREILDQGADLGLMRMRPIWLMNPDVASRVLPLKAGLFNLVIYDEASQMPVEHAVPTLFRAQRVVISGDEKQMPPTSFFASRIDGDEDDELDGDMLDDAATEAERTAHEETWNRREVKDCPDLLQLGRSTLPATTLEIHYRSKYRELIGYSNAAFYRGALSVPAQHPEAEIRRVCPIEVIRADGIYEGQTNPTEANCVVDVLAKIWSAAPEARPSIGVVTFNRKQADLVEDAIQKRVLEDPAFLRAYQQERDRTQGGEDMGFFVKNVENVQGDERDVIVFSTTFGRDKHGGFRRNFGVLGQTGGERRLNVAVTRAREKVILVTSMPINDVSDWLASGRAPNKPRDYLQAYLDYASKMSSGELGVARGTAVRLGTQAASREVRHETDGFAASVERFLKDHGYRPAASLAGDAFSLDFAIEDPTTGLFGIGIECDAPRHLLLDRARAREIWRPTVMSRAVPAVHRVSSHAWYHRPQDERRRLHAAVQAALGKERT